jgi:transcriptional regulator with XRE-family HTH domain
MKKGPTRSASKTGSTSVKRGAQATSPDSSAQGVSVSDDELEHKRELLARRLKETREYVGLSQQEAADRSGLSRLLISSVETGRRKLESVELSALARVYGQPVGFFLDAETSDDITDVQHIARAARELGETDRVELLRFAKFLSQYRTND